MEAPFSWGEFNRATVRPNLEDAAAIAAVICDAIFLTKLMERENIGDSAGVEIDWCRSERSFLRGV